MFLFPENMILQHRRKMKDDLSRKITQKYDIFFKLSKKMVFSKRAAPGHDISCIIWKDGIFSPENMIFFPWAGSERWPFSKNTWKYDIFCVHMRVLQTWCHGLLPKKKKKKKKNQRWSYPAKIRPKMIEVLDWILERAPAILCTFGWRHSTINNIQYIVPFSRHEMCLEVCLIANKGDYLSIRRWFIIPKMQERQ